MIPQRAIDLILEEEGVDQPARWPGEESGITLGYGYDLGYEKNFADDWAGHISSGYIARLIAAMGKTGPAARAIAVRFHDIKIAKEDALAVFMKATLPHYEQETLHVFPGLDRLPDLVRGALVSLVFNRGTDMVGRPPDRRAEMRVIRDAVRVGDLPMIAAQLRSMKRLWIGKGVNGLLVRRENEAKLVEAALS